MSGYRNPYTVEEERKILHYIIRKNAFYRLRGLEFWKEVCKDILPNRTYQSLHERFRKYIINNIQNSGYDLSLEEQIKIKTIYGDLARKKKPETKTTKTYAPLIRQDGPSNLAKDFIELSDSDDSIEVASQKKSAETSRTKSIGNASAIAKVTTRKKIQNSGEGENDVNPFTCTRLQSVPIIEDDSPESSDSEIFSLKECHWEDTQELENVLN